MAVLQLFPAAERTWGGLAQTFRLECDYPRSTESGRRCCCCCCAAPLPHTEGQPLAGKPPNKTARRTTEVGHSEVFSPAAARGASKDPPKPLRPDSPLLRLAHRPPCLAAVPDANHQPRGGTESLSPAKSRKSTLNPHPPRTNLQVCAATLCVDP